MSEHTVAVEWQHTTGEFAKGTYSRSHKWRFDGGLEVPASPSPQVVRPPWSDPAAVDPEEALVAAIASCHMLTFLHVARRAGFQVTGYRDQAVGHLTTGENGVPWMSEVQLRPHIVFAAEAAPGPLDVERLHADAHAGCYIANSVRTRVTVIPA